MHLETSFFIACYQMSDARILKSYRQMVVASIHITIKDYHKIRVKKEDPRVHKYYYQVTLKEFIIYAKTGKSIKFVKEKKGPIKPFSTETLKKVPRMVIGGLKSEMFF